MKKKIGTIFILTMLLLTNIAFADDIDPDTEPTYAEIMQDDAGAWNSAALDKPTIQSRSAVIFDRNSKQIIWGKQENLRVPMASTTKIMTAIILLESGKNLDETVTVDKKAASIGGSRLGLAAGDKITLNDLLYGLMLPSGNDAAVQIAITVGGSVQGFADMMNAKAKELGLKDTHFVTPHGLDNPEHYTTAYELALITDYALNIAKFREVVDTQTYTVAINGYPTQINNTNELLGHLDGVEGVKTGFTNNALRCLVTYDTRNNFNIITVVLGADTKKIRTEDSIDLIEYTYANYEPVDIKDMAAKEFADWQNINEKRININKGVKDYPELMLSNEEYTVYPVNKNEIKDINIEISSKWRIRSSCAEKSSNWKYAGKNWR